MAKMENKKKACCENCEYSAMYKGKLACDMLDLQVSKNDYCSPYYIGDGITPEQRIAELEAENAELKTRVQQFEHNFQKESEVRK
jgi:cell division protein FtsB